MELFQFQTIITLITPWPALAKRGIAIGAVCGGGSCGGGGGIPYRPRGITGLWFSLCVWANEASFRSF